MNFFFSIKKNMIEKSDKIIEVVISIIVTVLGLFYTKTFNRFNKEIYFVDLNFTSCFST